MSTLSSDTVADRVNQAIAQTVAELIPDQDPISRYAVEWAQRDPVEQMTVIQSLHLSEDDRDQAVMEVLEGLERKA